MRRFTPAVVPPGSRRPLAAAAAAVAMTAWLLAGMPGVRLDSTAFSLDAVVVEAAQPQDAPAAQPHDAAAPASQAHGAEATSHGQPSVWTFVARLLNFAILAGTLIYFLRSPFLAFLANRGAEIRGGLAKAADLRVKAARQIAEIERRLEALPSEIAALEARGAAEVAAEHARIRAAAEGERARLVEQARRQMEIQLRVARRELTAHAAGRAIAIAAERIRKAIGDDDQHRLVDRYLSRLRAPGASGVQPPAGAGEAGP